ncbi:MAG TPA: D-glycerate dehydrogenase [Myxococcaceae bacterium]|nr:D-glycerate dehydrogenase [Myxococcaceae bacterium]
MTPSRPSVLVTRAIPDAGLALLRESCDVELWPEPLPPSPAMLLERSRGKDGLLALLTDRIDATVMDAAGPGLRVISNMAVGVDNVDVAEATRRNIPVGNTPGVLTETTAELAFALLLAAARRLPEAERYVHRGEWKTWEPTLLLGREVYGATLGIVGLGRIGRAVARRALAFGMRVLATGRDQVRPMPDVTPVDLETLLRESDFISLHAPLTPRTRRMFDAAAFARMKPGAILVNTARGGLVDPEALRAALASGKLFAAALDVTEPEPIPPGDPLLSLPNCLVVPHVGSATVETRDKMATMAARNLLSGLRGERLPHCVNPEIYGPR